MIYVSSLVWMLENVAWLRPGHLISLMDSCAGIPTPPEVELADHLRIDVHDIVEPTPGYVAPAAAHVQKLLEFGEAWTAERPVLIHCMAGVSRSAAAALIIACQRNEGSEREIARRLRVAGGWVSPNARMVRIADDLLGRRGRLLDALASMGPPISIFADFPLALPIRLDIDEPA